MSAEQELEFLHNSQYVSLATRKRSGEFVATPVWFAQQGDYGYIFSAGQAGKVKRLRNFSEARAAACTVSGKLLGPWLAAEAELLTEEDDCATALAALRAKYGLAMRMGDLFSRISGKMQRRAYIRVQVRPQLIANDAGSPTP